MAAMVQVMEEFSLKLFTTRGCKKRQFAGSASLTVFVFWGGGMRGVRGWDNLNYSATLPHLCHMSSSVVVYGLDNLARSYLQMPKLSKKL